MRSQIEPDSSPNPGMNEDQDPCPLDFNKLCEQMKEKLAPEDAVRRARIREEVTEEAIIKLWEDLRAARLSGVARRQELVSPDMTPAPKDRIAKPAPED